jgi:DNA-binding MarR family transcriptional regulator
MTTKELQNQLSLTLMRASLKGKYGMVEVAEAHDITLQQAITVCLLEPDQAVRMSTVANYLTCDPSTITGVVDRLFTLGFIDRKEGSTDRRQKLISLTASGLTLRSKLLDIATTKRFPALDDLSDKEISNFISLINKATGGASLQP